MKKHWFNTNESTRIEIVEEGEDSLSLKIILICKPKYIFGKIFITADGLCRDTAHDPQGMEPLLQVQGYS